MYRFVILQNCNNFIHLINLNLSEENIISQLKNGNKLAFKHLFDSMYVNLRSFAFSYIKDDNSTDDFVQESFIALWNKRTDFDHFNLIKSFLYTSVKNKCLNYLKHNKVVDKNSESIKKYYLDKSDTNKIIEEQVHKKIYDAIAHLSPQARKIVIYSMNGLSNPEISEELGVSINTVKTQKKRSYKVLREKLDGVNWALVLILLDY